MKLISKRWHMGNLDRERILVKMSQLAEYLAELEQIAPASFDEYQAIEKRRACERLLQLSIESVIDICHRFVIGLRLGLPAQEDDLFSKLTHAEIISPAVSAKLREMRGFRNVLVHEYARVDDRLVFEAIRSRREDFAIFTDEIRQHLG